MRALYQQGSWKEGSDDINFDSKTTFNSIKNLSRDKLTRFKLLKIFSGSNSSCFFSRYFGFSISIFYKLKSNFNLITNFNIYLPIISSKFIYRNDTFRFETNMNSNPFLSTSSTTPETIEPGFMSSLLFSSSSSAKVSPYKSSFLSH